MNSYSTTHSRRTKSKSRLTLISAVALTTLVTLTTPTLPLYGKAPERSGLDSQLKTEITRLSQSLRDYSRKEMIFSYKEWKKAVSDPKSREALVVRYKARLINEDYELASEHLTTEEKKSCELEKRLVNEDLEEIKKVENGKSFEGFFGNLSKKQTLSLKKELLQTYGPVFDFQNIDDADRLILGFHRLYGYRLSDEKSKAVKKK